MSNESRSRLSVGRANFQNFYILSLSFSQVHEVNLKTNLDGTQVMSMVDAVKCQVFKQFWSSLEMLMYIILPITMP